MNNWALKTVSFDQLGDETTSQAKQLLTNISIKDVVGSIEENLSAKDERKPSENLYLITGEPGSGRTTFCKAVLKTLVENESVKESKTLFIKINRHDTVNCLWNYGVQLGESSDFADKVVSLASESSSYHSKREAMVAILNSFKVICFDPLVSSDMDPALYALVISIINKLSTNVLCMTGATGQNHEFQSGRYRIEVQGLNLAVIANDLHWQKATQYLKTNDNQLISLNPRAAQMLVNACQTFKTLNFQGNLKCTSVSDILNWVWENLNDRDREILIQLSELRTALPMKDMDILKNVIQLGFIEYEAPGKHGNLYGKIIMSDCVQDFVLKKKDCAGTLNYMQFDVLQSWMSLLSCELVKLIQDAKSNTWPFVPEKWQYTKDAGKEESYNIKDLITRKVTDLPQLTHFDVLQECLHHSVLRKNYEDMTALLFLIDRYIYWQGGSQTLLGIVDSIMREKPQLAIAPQLVIRKARVLRTSGDLQGAEKVLDKLLSEKQKLYMWHYSETHHYDLVKAVCVQIKGEIQATLGHWYTSASLLLDSVDLFKALPKVDKKGLSCSLGLLVNTFQKMSLEQYDRLKAQRDSLTATHSYIQAYDFAIEAAQLAVYTPLFYARHKRRAGEMMLEYSQFVTGELSREYLGNALKELKESLAAHKDFDSLKSREQYYEFISALYKTSCVLSLAHEKQEQLAQELKSLSMVLFNHYCRHQSPIVFDFMTMQYINTALRYLGMPAYVDWNSDVYGTTPMSSYHKPVNLANSPGSTRLLVDRCAETVQTLTKGSVDSSKMTLETMENNSGIISSQVNNDKVFNKLSLHAAGVYECEVSSFDVVQSKWKKQKTLVYIGKQLNLAKDKQGAQRDPFMVEYLSQDEPMGKYVGKRYQIPREPQQYKDDVRCQMTARYYVGLFNEELYRKGVVVSPVQFLPVVMVTLIEHDGEMSSDTYNVEPYMQGDFTKLTNNWNFVDRDGPGSQLVLAFSHFTHERSNRTLLITDHQGWTSQDHSSTTFLTDPQIHNIDKQGYGRGNLGLKGIHMFWQVMHPECNEICQRLELTRPSL